MQPTHDYPVSINAKGYRRLHIKDGTGPGRPRNVMEHVWVWEQVHGPLPPGWDVHHLDGDKANNAIENLLGCDRVTHKRLHSGCELRDGVWWKPCGGCGEFKPITEEHWYFRNGHPDYNRCRPCWIRQVVERKSARRAAARAAADPSLAAPSADL